MISLKIVLESMNKICPSRFCNCFFFFFSWINFLKTWLIFFPRHLRIFYVIQVVLLLNFSFSLFIAGIFKKTNFFVMNSYVVTLLNLFIKSNYLYIPQNFLCTKSCHLQIRVLILSDPLRLLIVFLPLLSWIDPSAQYWIKLVIAGIIVYFFDLGRNFQYFAIRYAVDYSLKYSLSN